MPHFLPRQKSYLRHGVMLLLASFLAILWSSVAWNDSNSEKRAIKDSRRQTTLLALLFTKHTTATFKSVDHALLELRQTWMTHPSDMRSHIKADTGFLGDAVLQTAIIDAHGFLVFSTLELPRQPMFLGDREHFKVHQGGVQDALFVSRPVKGRLLNQWAIQLTRPIFDKGKFAGVIVMSVDPNHFVDFYEKADLGKDGLAAMVRDTGEIMVHSSELDKYLGKVIKTSPYADPGAPLQGSFRRSSQTDGIERLFSYAHLPEYGLSVIIGASIAETLAAVHTQQRQILLVASGVTLLILLMGWQLLRTLKRKEAAQQALAESKAHLRASHELLETLSLHVPGMIFQYRLFPDGHSSFPYVSNGIQDIYGVTPAQVHENARPLYLNLHPDDYDTLNASIVESARTLQPWQHEYRVNLPQRGLRWLAGHAQPEKLDDGSVLWHGFVTDITENKDTEAALRAANQELETFSYSVSHDLRSPLSTIDGFSQLLARKLAGNDNALHYLARIRAGAAQMECLIADLLALAQVARAQMKHEPMDLSALASSIAQELQARQPEHQVTLQIEAGLQAQGDIGLLRVVLENLLGNAWKYSAKQSSAEIRFGQQPDTAGNPVFFVQDNGAGFDMANVDKLFHPFVRLHTEEEFSGTGIGLATVSRIIARHGGRIWAESAPGRGATFLFTLSPAIATRGLRA
ncbi:hypothetical protein BH10PSE16_BH10PSE16_15760 [soil metagenome]